MQKLPKGLLLFGILFIAIFAIGIIQLFQMRFSLGDIYPPYSSLRQDPLGTQIFYESLAAFSDLQVARNLEPLSKLKLKSDALVFVLGMESSWDSEGDLLSLMDWNLFQDLDDFVQHGGHALISFAPRNQSPDVSDKNDQKPSETKNVEKESQKPKSKKDQPKILLRAKEWGISFKNEALKPVEDPLDLPRATLSGSTPRGDLPQSIPCDTSLYFTKLTEQWDVIYSRDNYPVVVRRKLGQGSILFVASSYLFSNEAMFRERYSTLLSWVIGDFKELIFDEYHHGIERELGIAGLVYKYRLQGVGMSLILLAILFVWKNSVKLVPAYDELSSDQGRKTVTGKDAASGLINLLRQNIAAKDLLTICFQEWKKSHIDRSYLSSSKQQRMEAIVSEEAQMPVNKKNSVISYNALCQILAERK